MLGKGDWTHHPSSHVPNFDLSCHEWWISITAKSAHSIKKLDFNCCLSLPYLWTKSLIASRILPMRSALCSFSGVGSTVAHRVRYYLAVP